MMVAEHPTHKRVHFANRLRINRNSCRCFAFDLGESHFEAFERIEDDLGCDQPSVLFVICRNDIPGGLTCASRAEAFLIGLHVVLPEFPLFNIRKAELPVLFWLINTFKETLSLLFLREMKEEFDYKCSVAGEAPLQICDRTILVVPDRLLVKQCVRETFALKNLPMNSRNQNLFIVGNCSGTKSIV
jgi:hypothetical protein